MSGVDFDGTRLRKGAGDAILEWVAGRGRPGAARAPVARRPHRAARAPRRSPWPATARCSASSSCRDTVKEGMRVRFDHLRAMGIRTIMVTGDNRLTAAEDRRGGRRRRLPRRGDARAQARAHPRASRLEGRLVAMTGDGTNDAPALAQADVGVAMNTGTQAAREAGNMVDLDSNPTKLIEIVEVGKQLLITRGALTTFSIANDVAKYFAILPAIFVATYAARGDATGPLDKLNLMNLGSPRVGDHQRDRLQRADHPAARPARAARRALPPGRRDGAAAAQPAHLRRRRAHRAVRGHQAARPDRPQPAGRVTRRARQSAAWTRSTAWTASSVVSPQ